MNRKAWAWLGGIIYLLVSGIWLWDYANSPTGVATDVSGAGSAVREAITPEVQAPPALLAQWRDGRLVLRGRMPDADSRALVLARAGRIYGKAEIADELQIDEAADKIPEGVIRAFPPDLRAARMARLQWRDGRFALESETSSARARAELAAALRRDLGREAPVDARSELPGSGTAQAGSSADLLRARLEPLLREPVAFDPGSPRIAEDARRRLDEAVPLLLGLPRVQLLLAGHSDADGAVAGNQRLSEARAEAVRQHLMDRGVDGRRMVTVGFGSSRPVAPNDNEEGRRRNRRVEIQVHEQRKS
ncbi:MAG: OmpA family protein [Betaproteobacteria bacterium]|nr:OmpA family protein [Betaproteobacteria bacterium]